MNHAKVVIGAKHESHCSCRFCDKTKNNASRDVDHPWMESNNYYALASIGALVPGWSIIFPKKHDLNLSNFYLDKDFANFTEKAIKITESVFGKVTVFEHGCTTENSHTSCGTSHAHLHIVPLNFSLIDKAKQFDPAMVWEACNFSDIKEKSKNKEYLFISEKYSGIKTDGLICILEKEISQFFRQVIANEIGLGDKYNYKEYRMEETYRDTLVTLIDAQAINEK